MTYPAAAPTPSQLDAPVVLRRTMSVAVLGGLAAIFGIGGFVFAAWGGAASTEAGVFTAIGCGFLAAAALLPWLVGAGSVGRFLLCLGAGVAGTFATAYLLPPVATWGTPVVTVGLMLGGIFTVVAEKELAIEIGPRKIVRVRKAPLASRAAIPWETVETLTLDLRTYVYHPHGQPDWSETEARLDLRAGNQRLVILTPRYDDWWQPVDHDRLDPERPVHSRDPRPAAAGERQAPNPGCLIKQLGHRPSTAR